MASVVKWVLVCVLASIAAISCGGGGDGGHDAAVGGGGGGGTGAGGGTGGGGGGTGGTVADGGAGAGGSALVACPPSLDSPGAGGACQGTFTCNYTTQCTCGVCCYHGLGCSNGVLTYLGFNDGCVQVSPSACPDAGP